jgi:pSer/pThr/pTyr-binding forkhead associated (FHA) protein
MGTAMADQRARAGSGTIALHLLDSAQGHTLQSWRISDHSTVTIGRSDDNDIVIADPHVSRLHATLVHQDDGWTLVSLGRHGTLIDNRVISEAPLREGTLFRLGANGPILRFGLGELATSRSATLDNIDPEMLSMLNIDQERQRREVEQITENAVFKQLQAQLRGQKDQDETREPT